jgi:glutamyl-tRNA synthetase
MLEQGPTKNTVFMDWTTLWANNKKILDPIAPRYTAISTENICILEISNGPAEPRVESHPLHAKNTSLGNCDVSFFNRVLLEHDDAVTIVADEKITLMKWGNVVVHTVENADETFQGLPVKLKLIGEYLPEDKDFKNTKKLTWLAALPNVFHLDLVEFDVLITKPKIEENDDVMSLINVNSRFVTKAFGMNAVKEVKDGIVQLERRGFYRVDKSFENNSELIFIPDGKSKGMSTLGTKVDQKKINTGEPQKPNKKVQERAEKKKKELEKKAEGKTEEGKTEEVKHDEKTEEKKE